jgi:hypothetical protein
VLDLLFAVPNIGRSSCLRRSHRGGKGCAEPDRQDGTSAAGVSHVDVE